MNACARCHCTIPATDQRLRLDCLQIRGETPAAPGARQAAGGAAAEAATPQTSTSPTSSLCVRTPRRRWASRLAARRAPRLASTEGSPPRSLRRREEALPRAN